MEIHALAARGWSVSAIARHTGRDRKTVRRYLAGQGGGRRSALVAFEGNRYSVGPEHAGRRLVVRARVGEPQLSVLSPAGVLVATHRRAPAGAGQTIRSREHAAALEQAVLAAFTTQPTCRRKTNRPPGETALAELARLRGIEIEAAPVISLEHYAQLAEAC